MSLGYKRRKKAIKAGTYETPTQRHVRVMGEFVEHVRRAAEHAKNLPPEIQAEVDAAAARYAAPTKETT